MKRLRIVRLVAGREVAERVRGRLLWAITALADPPCTAQERPAARYDIAAWVESYRRGLPEPPARTQPKTHPPEPGKSVGLPPPLPERVGATGALPDDRLPADQVRPSPSQGGDQ